MRTAFAHNPPHEAHFQRGHVERPERLEAILALVSEDPALEKALVRPRAGPVDLDVARLVHTDAYLRRLETAVGAGGARLDPDTYATAESLAVALEGLGALLAATRAVLDGEAENGFAAVRPPGHHATPGAAMGFCLLSNVAVAARRAQRRYGVERVLIVDFDVHHGNGTQDAFYEDPNVLVASTHQHPLYPGTGALRERGAGAGDGATINLPLPPRTGDEGYLRAFRRVLRPLARRFRPELILLSAGYDAHWRDPLSDMHLSVEGFGRLVLEVMEWADAWCENRLVAALEGGYDAGALAHGVRATLRLLQDPSAGVEDPFGPPRAPDADVTAYLADAAGFFGV
jgi:acetoin utilization deacetylase AcuC-like enzyme